MWSDYSEPEFRDGSTSPDGGYVQATGITRAYPDMPPRSRDARRTTTTLGDDADGRVVGGGVAHKMGRPGGYDPVARLVDMDDEGIDVAVLYPTAMLTWIEEPDIFGAACRAYNNWLHDYCAAAPTGSTASALVPLQDPDAAIAEMRALRRATSASRR